MDLTFECIQLHYAKKPGSPLSGVIDSYADFFALFDDFKGFVDFFHFQDLVTEDYSDVQFFMRGSKTFERPGTPVRKDEYVEYREATLKFIQNRGRRMATWITQNCSGDCGSGALSPVQ